MAEAYDLAYGDAGGTHAVDAGDVGDTDHGLHADGGRRRRGGRTHIYLGATRGSCRKPDDNPDGSAPLANITFLRSNESSCVFERVDVVAAEEVEFVEEKKFVGRPFDDAGLAILTSYDTVLDSWKGMSKHESQFVWYRKAFVIFSKFSYVNTFWRR